MKMLRIAVEACGGFEEPETTSHLHYSVEPLALRRPGQYEPPLTQPGSKVPSDDSAPWLLGGHRYPRLPVRVG